MLNIFFLIMTLSSLYAATIIGAQASSNLINGDLNNQENVSENSGEHKNAYDSVSLKLAVHLPTHKSITKPFINKLDNIYQASIQQYTNHKIHYNLDDDEGIIPNSIQLYDFLTANNILAPKSRYFVQIAAFYRNNNYTPVWITNRGWSKKAKQIINHLKLAKYDGLNPANYQFSKPYKTAHILSDGTGLLAQNNKGYISSGYKYDYLVEKQQILTTRTDTKTVINDGLKGEFLLSQAIVKYAMNAYYGQIAPWKIDSKDIWLKKKSIDPLKIMTAITSADDPVKMLDDYNPTHPVFKSLRSELAKLIDAKKSQSELISEAKPSLKLGMRDQRVIALRKRLELDIPESGGDIYDIDVKKAVKQFQKNNHLKVDGVAGKRTIRTINGGSPLTTADILTNMELWRWLPHKLGQRYVLVNAPEFRMMVYNKGKIEYSARVVIGKNKTRTPLFSDKIEYMVVNPYWNIPKSIMTDEYLPIVKSNPGYLLRKEIEVITWKKGRASQVNPFYVNWQQVEKGQMSVLLRQKPGKNNALGRIKFMFPNRYSIYIHDTPSKHLFNRGKRAFSHGCVRIENPLSFADFLLRNDNKWNRKRIKKLFGDKPKRIHLRYPLRIHIAYFTVFIDKNGQFIKLPDVYGYDKKLRHMLNIS